MATYEYSVVLSPEPDGSAYNVTVPALPGCVTWGATIEQAVAMAQDAIALWLEDMAADGEEIPIEVAAPVVRMVKVELAAPVSIGA